MIHSPARTQLQLSEAISVIASHDFPAQWPDLIGKLVTYLSAEQLGHSVAVLQTIHTVFKKWRSQFRSDELFTEIKYALTQFCEPYLKFFMFVDESITKQPALDALKQLFTCLTLIAKIFKSMCSQDLPEFIEDNLATFMGLFIKYLQYQNAALVDDDDTTPDELTKLKAVICDITKLFVVRYEEEFQMLPAFVETIWMLLTSLGEEPKYDYLACESMLFLASVIKVPRRRAMFQEEKILTQICESIVLKNMFHREADVELMEDDPFEYIRRDLQGADSSTRRRAASELAKTLLDAYEAFTLPLMSGYMETLLKTYAANPAANWKSKDAALELFTVVASKGATQKHGITTIRTGINLEEFFHAQVASALAVSATLHPLLVVALVKFVTDFRSLLAVDSIKHIFPSLAKLIQLDNFVLYTYAASCIERLLAAKRLSLADIKEYVPFLLQALLTACLRFNTPDKVAENDYLINALMRVIFIGREMVPAFANDVFPKLVSILTIIYKNPSNPRYNHFLFESISMLIRYSSSGQVKVFETNLLPLIDSILRQDIPEFAAYSFQILAQLIQSHPSGTLPDAYKTMLPIFLQPTTWESRGNIPGLTVLICSFLSNEPQFILQFNFLPPVLGIFQKLIGSRLNDHFGADIFETILYSFDRASLEPFLKPIMTLLLTRLQTSPTPKFTTKFVYLMLYIASLQKPGFGAVGLLALLDSIQPGLGVSLLKSFIIQHSIQVNTSALERRVALVGLCSILETEQFASQPYQFLWPQTVESIAILFTQPVEKDESAFEEKYLQDLEEGGYQASATQLSVLSSPKPDPTAFAPDVTAFVKTKVASVGRGPQTPNPSGAAAAASMGLSMIGNAVEAKKCALPCCPKKGLGSDRACEKQSESKCNGYYSAYPGQGDHACYWDHFSRKCVGGSKCRDKTFSGWQLFGASCPPCVDITPETNAPDYDLLTKCPRNKGLGCDNCCHKQPRNRCDGFYADYKGDFTNGKGKSDGKGRGGGGKGKGRGGGNNRRVKERAGLVRRMFGGMAMKAAGAGGKAGMKQGRQSNRNRQQPQQQSAMAGRPENGDGFVVGADGRNVGVLDLPPGTYALSQQQQPVTLPQRVYYPLGQGQYPYKLIQQQPPQGDGAAPPKPRTNINVDKGSGDYMCGWVNGGCYPQRKCGDW